MNHVAKIRKGLNMSQETLAKKAKVSRPYLSNVENLKVQPSVGAAIRISKALNKRVEDIFLDKT
ncbi:helix-turn-helix transcriptional regulator [Bacillus thuringiensis]|uniref:Helix-turn-helix domain-containing protein n=1 Tax=Bacillus thuringiensis TaxID=1428 RepID=A0A4Y8T4Y7_BACTU|nr:helix-turn-helix domain-containing protein [Bacillus thuringiensis]MDA2309934.1 helix-turn-helix domain-containing protein [Bacillus cereus]MDA2314668.1 helix-turn-helix domain-containing protein [Bacillus cereus]MDA2499340.1 helix-turn-helix domain-containing protein [Bacillus cereus]TFF45807.1 helix-turn-helix domain-containing protein [Bacillus thuringiensis]HDR4614593.1 helix-turn-helix domain-containing protein [Bacillus cereus]